MQGVALLVALSALSVDHTWRQTEDRRVEYVLQIEPVFLTALAEGKEVSGELPAEIARVDRICLRIGSSDLRTLAQQAPPWPELDDELEKLAAARTPPAETPLAIYAKPNGELFASYDLAHGWQPASETEATYLIQLSPDLLKVLEEGDEIYANVFPEAGPVRSFRITSGKARMPRKSARPPVVPVTQLQTQGAQGRTSSPAADVPPTSDFTGGGGGGSIYAGTEATDLTTGGNPNRSAGQPAPLLAPPVDPSLEVPQFDGSQFRQPSQAGSSVRAGTNRPAGAAAASRPAPRQTQMPAEQSAFGETEEYPQVAARTTTSSFPQRRVTSSATAAEEKEPEFPALPFTLSLFALFLSVGANLYLGWTAAEFYSRYKLAVERLRSAGRG